MFLFSISLKKKNWLITIIENAQGYIFYQFQQYKKVTQLLFVGYRLKDWT